MWDEKRWSNDYSAERNRYAIARFRFSRKYSRMYSTLAFHAILRSACRPKNRKMPNDPDNPDSTSPSRTCRAIDGAPMRRSERNKWTRIFTSRKVGRRIASRVKSRSGQNNFRAIGLKCEPCNQAANFISSSATAGPAAGFIPPIIDLPLVIPRAYSRRQSRRGPEITNFSA